MKIPKKINILSLYLKSLFMKHNLSEDGLELIKKHESFRSCAYKDPVNIPTIGYGNTFYRDGTKVTMNDKCITEEEATELLKDISKKFENFINRKVTKPLLQNQFDALVSFVYNVGTGNFENSTLLKRINIDPNDPDIKYQFSRWNKAGGKVLKGLTKRRKEEAELYFSHLN